jgi:hypothetical protein
MSFIDFGILESLNVLVMLFGWSKLPHLAIDGNKNPNFIQEKNKRKYLMVVESAI